MADKALRENDNSDSDDTFDIQSIPDEPVSDTEGPEPTFIDAANQKKLEGCSIVVEGELSESRSRAEKINKPGLVKMNNGSVNRAWFVVHDDELVVHVITDGESACELSKKLAPKKAFTYPAAQKARRTIAKAVNDNSTDDLKSIAMCSATIDYIIKTQKPPRKRPANSADGQEKAGPAKKVKAETLEVPKSPLGLKRTKSHASPASTPTKKLRPPISSVETTSNPTGKYTITKQTQVTLTVPTLGELKEVQRWCEA